MFSLDSQKHLIMHLFLFESLGMKHTKQNIVPQMLNYS